MHSANLLLIALAFVFGLVLTFALMIGRVEAEAPTAPAGSEPPTDTASADTDPASS
ncbi:hypothetical protein [Mycobacterium sp.]|uniref:channel accessory protein ArfC n=1 Tax=Mycobacterium sp. TaxID=1785 RepID=UPI0025D8C8E7|nr:hypothetical protein [Mycobacterium sp.]